jgi:2-deoxy-D-gluconate 3-dehydrogenase
LTVENSACRAEHHGDDGLEGKVALVTGATRGIGKAIVAALVHAKVKVIAFDREHPGYDDHNTIDGPWPVTGDVRHLADAPAVISDAYRRHDRLDILVNNAGIMLPPGPFADQPLTNWNDLLMSNLLGAMALSQAHAKRIQADGSTGSILNVTSIAGLRGKKGLVAYSVAKAGLIRFTEAFAGEVAPHVRVNAVAPGAIETNMQSVVVDDERLLERRLRKIPIGRLGTPNDVAALVRFLLSDNSSFITGSTFLIDGGEHSLG